MDSPGFYFYSVVSESLNPSVSQERGKWVAAMDLNIPCCTYFLQWHNLPVQRTLRGCSVMSLVFAASCRNAYVHGVDEDDSQVAVRWKDQQAEGVAAEPEKGIG